MRSHIVAKPIITCLLAAGMVAACQQQAPKGQVLAVVNGEEVTAQDVATERRNLPGGAQLPAAAVLQKVVARVLLAQAAHARRLDAGPDYPGDLARLKQDLLARRMLEATVHAPPTPTAAQIAAVIAAHPYQFADRARIRVDQLGFQGDAAWTAVHDLGDLQAVAARLNGLGVPFDRVSRVLDTAELPADLAAKLATQPLGKLFFVRQGEQVAGIIETERTPTPTPAESRAAIAASLIEQDSAKSQTAAIIGRLRKEAKIRYQPGYEVLRGSGSS